MIVPLPVDVREIFRHPTHSGETLIASDQGLYLVGQKVKKKEKDPKSGKVKVHAFDVYLKNLAESRDHSEVYGVEVDACGCVYAGQWHGSATFTCGLSWVYRGGEAKGLFTGKNRLTCDKGNEWISNWGELNEKTTFRTYATRCKDNPQLFCKRKIMSKAEHNQLDDPPTIAIGQLGQHYPEKNTPAIYVELTKNPVPSWKGFKPGGYFIYKARNGNLYLRPAGIDDLKKFPQRDRNLLLAEVRDCTINGPETLSLSVSHHPCHP